MGCPKVSYGGNIIVDLVGGNFLQLLQIDNGIYPADGLDIVLMGEDVGLFAWSAWLPEVSPKFAKPDSTLAPVRASRNVVITYVT